MSNPRPAAILGAAAITIAMAGLVALIAMWDLATNLSGMTGPQIGTDAYYLVVAALLIPASMALLSGRAWPRAVLATAHLLLVLSMLALSGFLGWLAAIPAGLSVTALALLATPAARAFVAANRRPGFLFADEADS